MSPLYIMDTFLINETDFHLDLARNEQVCNECICNKYIKRSHQDIRSNVCTFLDMHIIHSRVSDSMHMVPEMYVLSLCDAV